MANRRRRKEFEAYLKAHCLEGFSFASPAATLYGLNKDTLFVFEGPVHCAWAKLHQIRSACSLARAVKRAHKVKLWTGQVKVQYYTQPQDTYQEFESWDAFREYCLTLRLSGL